MNYNGPLPSSRNIVKDTKEFLGLMNTKIEFLRRAKDIKRSYNYYWIDMGILKIVKNREAVLKQLRHLHLQSFMNPFSLITIPGCWEQRPMNTNEIHWRFCGGFMLGDAGSIVQFYQLYDEYFPLFMRNYRKLVWEVNFWGWLEANSEWKPRWYSADHNDCIIKTPVDIYTVCLKNDLTITRYNYPKIETYEPMQACCINYKGRQLLNTRYVNYWYLESGHCHIKHPEDFIISKNLLAELDNDTFMPIKIDENEFREMQDETICLHSNRCYFYGLEDIRLYEYDGKLKFIATF
jgi:hypothetical protein